MSLQPKARRERSAPQTTSSVIISSLLRENALPQLSFMFERLPGKTQKSSRDSRQHGARERNSKKRAEVVSTSSHYSSNPASHRF